MAKGEVTTKRCVRCGEEKPASGFYAGSCRDGLSSRCRICHERLACRSPEHRREQRRRYAEASGKVFKDRAFRDRQRQERAEVAAERLRLSIDARSEARIRTLLREKVKNQIKKRKRKGHLDWRIRDSLVNDRWSPTILKALGYTVGELKRHMERQFTKGMSWSAFAAGEIHIDHIVPVRAFDLSKDDDVRACWAMTNLRPMWAEANIAKGGDRLHLL